ncbi:MAG: hypothetical protein AAGK23_14275 [Pseudomonadota bacterium]
MSGFCFDGSDEGWLEDWRRIWKFSKKWCGVPAATNIDMLDDLGWFKTLETVPPSILQWLAFCDHLKSTSRMAVLRDNPRIERLEKYKATSLLLQGEGDFHWVVLDADLHKSDPPISGFSTNYNSDDPTDWIYCGQVAENLTSFVIQHMCHFMYSSAGSAILNSPDEGTWYEEMTACFDVTYIRPGLHVFEKPEVVAIIFNDVFDKAQKHMSLSILNARSVNDIPDCAKKLITNGGAFSGVFAELARPSS